MVQLSRSHANVLMDAPTAEEAKRDAQLFQVALDNMSQGLCMFDENQQLILCNRRYLKIYGFSENVVKPGVTLQKIMEYSVSLGNYGRDQAETALLARPRHADRRDEAVLEQKLCDGRIIAVKHCPMENGGSVALYEDITEEKRRNGALESLSQKLGLQNLMFESALNNMIQGLAMFDADHTMMVCNRRYLEIYGFSPSIVKPGISLEEILDYSVSLGNYSPEVARRTLTERRLQAAQCERAVHEQHLNDGRVIAVMHQPMGGGSSVVTYQDVTELKQREKEIVELTRTATVSEAENRAKSEFLANMSLELRTPLNAIVGLADTMHSEVMGAVGVPAYHTYLTDIIGCGENLLGIIQDVLNMSQIEAGRVELHETDVDLQQLMESCLESLKSATDGRTVSMVSRNRLTPVRVRGDAAKLGEMIRKVVSNAAKFTGTDGKIEIALELAATGGATITVRDNGIGIAPEDIDKVIEPFAQTEGAYARKYGGTGLGLPIAKSFAELHDGTLELESSVGVGTTVFLRLPASRVL